MGITTEETKPMTTPQSKVTMVVDDDVIIGSVPNPAQPMDSECRVIVGTFNRRLLVNVRFWNDIYGERRATKKGVALPADPQFLRHVAMLIEQAAAYLESQS